MSTERRACTACFLHTTLVHMHEVVQLKGLMGSNFDKPLARSLFPPPAAGPDTCVSHPSVPPRGRPPEVSAGQPKLCPQRTTLGHINVRHLSEHKSGESKPFCLFSFLLLTPPSSKAEGTHMISLDSHICHGLPTGPPPRRPPPVCTGFAGQVIYELQAQGRTMFCTLQAKT